MKLLLKIVVYFLYLQSSFADELNQKALTTFKNSINSITSAAIDFIQTDSRGQHAKGKLLISKPFNFRCNYYPPYPLLIVGGKNYVSVYDFELEQISRIKAVDNIFNFLLVNNIDLEKHFVIESAKDYKDIIEVILYHNDSEKRTRVTFNKINTIIKQIEVFEEDNIITLNFANYKKVKSFTQDLFILKNPDIYGKPKHLDFFELEKKIIYAE